MADLDRRQFFTVAAAAAFAPMLPPLPEVPAVVTVDPVAGSIVINSPMTLLELHRELSDLFDGYDLITHEMPTMRITDLMFELNKSWKIQPRSWRNLSEGSILTEDGILSDMTLDQHTNFSGDFEPSKVPS